MLPGIVVVTIVVVVTVIVIRSSIFTAVFVFVLVVVFILLEIVLGTELLHCLFPVSNVGGVCEGIVVHQPDPAATREVGWLGGVIGIGREPPEDFVGYPAIVDAIVFFGRLSSRGHLLLKLVGVL